MEYLKMFSTGARPSKTGPTPTGEMGYNLSIKRSSMPHENCKLVKETTLQTQMPTQREMLTAKNCISKPYGDLPHEPRRHENDGKLFQQKASENSPKPSMMVRAADYDELVRYMSNVPGYLQRVEKKEDMKGKALNVGVLDWGRLENYKCNQKGISVGIGSSATLPCINLSTEMTTGLSVLQNPSAIETPCGNKQRLSSSSKHNSYANGDIFPNATLSSQDAEFSNDEHRVAAPNYRSSVTNNSDRTLAKSKRRDLDDKTASKVEHQPSKTKHKRVPVRPKESLSSYDRAKQTADDLQGLDIKREAPKQVFTPNMGTSMIDPTDRSSGSKKKKLNVDNCGTKNQIGLQKTAGNPPRQHDVDKSRNIVLLLPRPVNSFPNQTRMSQDENVPDAKQNFLSDAFSDRGAFCAELRDEIPHSCPLPSRNYASAEKKMAPDAKNSVDAEASSNVINATTSERLDETSKMLSQETVESATRKGRHRSPNRRFSFSSLSQMTRSFSFRENSAPLPLSSTYVSVKSGPVTSTSSAGMVDLNREKECGHIRARSSPLRRILDPLLPKFKGRTSSFSDETDQQSRGSCDSSFKPIKVVESHENDETKASSMQAQLVITTSNGLPVYRFVTNSSIMIAAPLKNVIAPGKNDPQSNYALHSIDEIKKKSGSWINQASKEKACFVYNMVGEMKLNRKPSLSGENLENQDLVKESVLIGVEPRQTGQALPKGMPNTELAAVIMKRPSGFMGYDVHCSDKKDTVKNNICTVILPSGIHSVPKTGVPSSLVHRWKSGGSCDCGGWDIGCQLRILANDNRQPKLSRTFSSFLRSDCLELFVQGETQQKKPIFSMAPFGKEKYSLEFSSSISLLQAFFIGVSVITCQRSSDLTEDSYMSEEKAFWKSSNGIDCWKTARKDAPMKYTPTPPLSPVGRV